MPTITVNEILEATGGKLLTENSKTFSGVSIDSRSISDGEVFFAIKGEKFDGHDFLDSALEKCDGAVLHSHAESLPGEKVLIHVDDTLQSLQDLAHFLRMKRNVPVVAVTGSNGKTTTKEIIYSILSERYKTLRTMGNFNNHIGLPLTLLKLETDDELIVLEMGMNSPGEIRRLCEIAVPSHAVITNIGTAHMGRLGSREAIRDAKLEILEGLNVAVVNADDDFLLQGINNARNYRGRLVTFGIVNEAHVMARNVRPSSHGSDFDLAIKEEGSVTVSLGIHGQFNIYNALAAAAASTSLGVSIAEIQKSLETFTGFPMRFEMIRKGGINVINDSYNANPSSMKESLRGLILVGAMGRRVAVLGDMSELDEFSEEEHTNIGRVVSELRVDVFVAIGEKMGLAAKESMKVENVKPIQEVYSFINVASAEKAIMEILKDGDTVLVKGSRAMSMEKIVEDIVDAV
jgi:UDP-N-acetylmuramoyl-tripeptide--D-alanyl-D-alanine ligase